MPIVISKSLPKSTTSYYRLLYKI